MARALLVSQLALLVQKRRNLSNRNIHTGLVFSLGFVFEAIDRDTGQTVAVKRTMKAGEYESREYQVHHKLQECTNVVRLLNIYYSKTEDDKCVQNMVFEYCSTNLEDVIQSHKSKNQPIPMDDIRDYMRQIFEGMAEVHAREGMPDDYCSDQRATEPAHVSDRRAIGILSR